MSDEAALVQQVSAITGCNDFQAKLVLERCNWDMERAMNSFFDDPPPEKPVGTTTTQSVPSAGVTSQGAADNQLGESGWEAPNTQVYGPPPGPPSAPSQGWAQRNKDVIDLTNDADVDEDLRRAMAASLQDQQSQQAYRPPPPSSTVGDVGMSEDEQLRQALEASVQSHHDLMQSNGSGARTPALPHHLETDVQSRRISGAPIAMVAPFASLEVVAALLQALFAAPPVRRAYLAARPVDPRGFDLSNYWRGSSPTDGSSDPNALPATQAHFQLVQRIQTLFAFAQLSQRPLCVVKDVASLAPSEVVARGADHSPPARVASLFYEFVVESLSNHIAAVSEAILNAPGAEPLETDTLWMNDGLFLSSGAAALTDPASPRTTGLQNASDASIPAPPKMEQQRSFIQLRHDSINSDTYSCLRAALASDGEGALLTRTAQTISMGIEHALHTADRGGLSPFSISERIYLDSLMWDRRQGVRLDAELQDLEMVRLDALRQDLEARKRKLAGDAGRPLSEVLQGAKRYFDEVASTGDGTDAVRLSSLAEAPPQISKILEAIQTDLIATDQLIAQVRAQMDAKRTLVAERAKREAANPEWTQLAYDLCAVLCHEGGHCVSMVKQQDGSWWKVVNGRAVKVDKEDVVMGRPQDPYLSVFWVVYARAEDDAVSTEDKEAAMEALVPEMSKAAVADDNLTYESELLSLIRSDAATPSSIATRDNDGANPLAEGVIDLTNAAEPDREDVIMTGDTEIQAAPENASKSPRTN